MEILELVSTNNSYAVAYIEDDFDNTFDGIANDDSSVSFMSFQNRLRYGG